MRPLTILASICLFFVIILGSLNIMVFQKSFYYSEYHKLNVYDAVSEEYNLKTNESIILVEDITNNVLNFFKGRSELKYFEYAEQKHMEDVKNIIVMSRILYYIFFAIFIALFFFIMYKYKNNYIHVLQETYRMLLYSSIACFAFILLLFLSSVFYFDAVFYLVHAILFPQGNFTFSNSLLTTVFPEQFFFDMGMRIVVYASAQSFIFLVGGWWIRRNLKLHKYHR